MSQQDEQFSVKLTHAPTGGWVRTVIMPGDRTDAPPPVDALPDGVLRHAGLAGPPAARSRARCRPG
jgi:hypothetical protein